MNLLLLKGQSQNGVLRGFIDDLAKGFEGGAQAEVVDLLEPNAIQNAGEKLLSGAYEYAITFNAVLTDLDFQHHGVSHNLFNVSQTKHITWMVDHPAYHYKRLSAPNKRRVTILSNAMHLSYVSDMGFPGVFLASMAATSKLSEPVPYGAKAYDVVFAASWMGEPERHWAEMSSPTVNIIDKCVEQAIEQGVDIYATLHENLATQELKFDNPLELAQVVQWMYTYLRRHERLKTFEALMRTDLSIQVIGRGWENRFENTRSNVEFTPEVNYSDLSEYYKNSRAIVNLNAQNGGSERIFDGLAQSAVGFTQTSALLTESFDESSGVISYVSDPFAAADRLANLVSQENRWQAAVELGRHELAANHLWAHRAHAVLASLVHC